MADITCKNCGTVINIMKAQKGVVICPNCEIENDCSEQIYEHASSLMASAGNEVSALAMYNAGTGRVRSNKTPQSTLNYVGKIMTYQKMLESLFEDEVEAYYETRLLPGITVALADKR